MDIIHSIFSGIASAVITKTCTAPLERLKLLKQSQLYYGQRNYAGIYSSFKFILENEGILAFLSWTLFKFNACYTRLHD